MAPTSAIAQEQRVAIPVPDDLRTPGHGAVPVVTGASRAGATGTGALLQLLAPGDRIPAGHNVDVPRYRERGVGVCHLVL